MKTLLMALSSLVLCGLLFGGQHGMPVPPGMREADKLPHPGDVAPQIRPQREVSDPAQLKRDADELAKLAESIPDGIEQLAAGRLPKDLGERLKRIEKLSKKLRREVSP